MSNPLRDPVSAPLVVGGAVVALAAVAVGVWRLVHQQSYGALLVVVVAGLVVELSGAAVHDRRHRHRGEAPHAMWGESDRNRPRWLGGPRA